MAFGDNNGPQYPQGQNELGTPQVQGKHKLFDYDSPDIKLASLRAKEMISISGADVTVYPRIKKFDYDKTWEEDPNPLYGSGRKLKAFFVPKPTEAIITMAGIDAPNQMSIVFSRQDVIEIFGDRYVIPGDIIDAPYGGSVLKPRKYRIINAQDTGNFKYVWMYITCVCETIPDDITIDITHK